MDKALFDINISRLFLQIGWGPDWGKLELGIAILGYDPENCALTLFRLNLWLLCFLVGIDLFPYS